MKTLEQLREFFNSELINDLQALEQKRKSLLNRVIITAGICLSIGLVVGLLITANDVPVGLFFGLIPAIGISGIIISFMTRGYACDFKNMIIEKLINQIQLS